MRRLLVAVVVFCLLTPALALALTIALAFKRSATLMTAVVVSIDQKARSISFTYTEGEKEVDETATWNDETQWMEESTGEKNAKAAPLALAPTITEGSKIYAKVENGVFSCVTLLAPPAKP